MLLLVVLAKMHLKSYIEVSRPVDPLVYLGVEELLRLVQPAQRIFSAIILGKSERVDSARTHRTAAAGSVGGEGALVFQHLHLVVAKEVCRRPCSRLTEATLVWIFFPMSFIWAIILSVASWNL